MRVLPHVTLVGDFTSGCFADANWSELPNGWRYSYSKNLFVDYAGRSWEGIGVPPDIMVRGAMAEGDVDQTLETAIKLLANDGPALQDEAASAVAARIALVETLISDFQTSGLVAAREAFRHTRANLPPEKWYVGANEINQLGYELLGNGMLKEAVAVFELYVEAYPKDANAYDSLGEGFMNNGNYEQAIIAYERSLTLNPENQNAVQMLQQLLESSQDSNR
jgi:tetratricopeptide (TPR) repeat protein